MPIHDWSCVDANLFHDFHQSWTIEICHALNGGLLPKRHAALVEPHSAGIMPDANALKLRARLKPAELLAALGNRIAIHHPLGRVVSVIEIMSPAQKSSLANLQSFVEKMVDFLHMNIHVLVVDLFPPSPWDKLGIHKAIWDEIEDNPFALPPNKPLTLAAYVAGVVKVAYVEPFGVGDVLPGMPAFLDPDRYVSVPLAATYQTAWTSCPEMMREAVEQGEPLTDEFEE